ncbi:MAG: cytochrome c maturation protein CcmE [Legionellales bacterium]|nr:cytochrome c maturation protein CcmE [Legionellales bacterium]
MKPRRLRQLTVVLLVLTLLSIATALVLYALRQNISLFYSPSQVVMGEAPSHHSVRVGGMVVPGSVVRKNHDLKVQFEITDYAHTIVVSYTGTLPDLFREGKGVVAEGVLVDNHHVKAHEVLAKHDENYMPPEVKAALDVGSKNKDKA